MAIAGSKNTGGQKMDIFFLHETDMVIIHLPHNSSPVPEVLGGKVSLTSPYTEKILAGSSVHYFIGNSFRSNAIFLYWSAQQYCQ